jgi:hypothetical protein
MKNSECGMKHSRDQQRWRIECMGDKSPKSIHKKQGQQQAKEDKKVKGRRTNAEIQHHPVSGHPFVPEKIDDKK